MDIIKYLKELEYLVNIDSGSDCPDGTKEITDFFSDKFSRIGWNVKEYDFSPKSGTCLVCTNKEADHYDLMLIGHMDTVFPKGTANERPFRIEENIAYGPGVCDMKSGCLLMYYLMKELPKEIMDKLNIVVVYNPDEEMGSHCSKEVYKDYAEKTDYVYLYEATSQDGSHTVERKGGCFMIVEFFGAAGHCGYVFTNGSKSAVSEMAKWIVKLDELQSEDRNTTVNIVVEEGGTKSNIVPEYAKIKVDIRFEKMDEVERVENVLNSLLKQAEINEIKTKVTKRIKPALAPTEKGKEYISHLKEITKKNDIDFKLTLKGGHSDANIIAPLGPVCLDCIGPRGSKAHNEGEYMNIDSVLPMFELSNLLIKDLAENKEEKK